MLYFAFERSSNSKIIKRSISKFFHMTEAAINPPKDCGKIQVFITVLMGRNDNGTKKKECQCRHS